MIKNNKNLTNLTKETCKVHVMPPLITDNDISALLNGVINIVKKKYELETQADFINMHSSINKLKKQLQEKNNECARLKNEIIYLKQELQNLQS